MYPRPTFWTQPLRTRPMIECAQCFERIYTAEWSEYLDECHVRHLWACPACGYSFETLVKFPVRPAA